MKKSIISLVLALALGCEITPITTPRVTSVYPTAPVYLEYLDPTDPNVACEYSFYHNRPTHYEFCTSYDNIGDCDCYRTLDYSVTEHECYVDYCFYWDTCQWETYDYICY